MLATECFSAERSLPLSGQELQTPIIKFNIKYIFLEVYLHQYEHFTLDED